MNYSEIPEGAHGIYCKTCRMLTAYHQTYGKPCDVGDHEAECLECPKRITLPIIWGGGLRPIGGECCDQYSHEDDPPELAYSTSGDNHKLTKLLGDLVIGGASFHIEAWEVYYSTEGEQLPVCERENSYYDITAYMTEGAGQTVEINGRSYFIVVTPFQQ